MGFCIHRSRYGPSNKPVEKTQTSHKYYKLTKHSLTHDLNCLTFISEHHDVIEFQELIEQNKKRLFLQRKRLHIWKESVMISINIKLKITKIIYKKHAFIYVITMVTS